MTIQYPSLSVLGLLLLTLATNQFIGDNVESEVSELCILRCFCTSVMYINIKLVFCIQATKVNFFTL